MPRLVGICTVIGVHEMQVITYALATFELARAQALELQTGVDGMEDLGESSENGLRRHTYRHVASGQLIQVQELEVGTNVLRVTP